MKKERGVLFNQDMVRAVLDGTKTQTRRICQVQPPYDDWELHTTIGDAKNNGRMCFVKPKEVILVEGITRTKFFTPPLGKVGHRLYVRERARLIGYKENGGDYYQYEADGTKTKAIILPDRIKPIKLFSCCSNGCFKELARIWLEITGVRVERNEAGGWEWIYEFKRIEK